MEYNGYNANIWKFYLYKVFTSLQITVPIYVLFLLANNLSMTQVMLLQSFYTFLIFFFEIPSGVFADLYGRKNSLILSSIFLTFAFITFGFGRMYIIFFLAAFLWAISQSLKSGADTAILFDSLKIIDKTNLFTRYNGRSNSLEMLTLGISAVIGGVIANYFGNRILFFISAILFFVSVIISISFKEPTFHKKIIEKKYLAHMKEALLFSYKNKIVKSFIVFFAFFGAFAYMLYFLIQPFFNQGEYAKFIVGIAVAGYFVFCSIGSFFSEHIISKIKPKKLAIIIVLISLTIFLLMPNISKWFAILLVFVHSFIAGVAGVLANNEINKNTESHHRATVLSVLNFLQKIIYAVVAPFIGYFTDVYTLDVAFLMVGILLLIFFIFMIFSFSFISNRKSSENLVKDINKA